MAWLIGIICVVIVVTFWRIFLPLGILALVGIIVLFILIANNEEKGTQEMAQQEKALQVEELRQKKIAQARANATHEGKEWRLDYQKDPASGIMIARQAHIESNDSLCTLTIKKQLLNGVEAADIDCPDFNVSAWDGLEVKFSDASNSIMMLFITSNGKDIHIYSWQDDSEGYLSYDDFIEGLKNNKSVAIKIQSEDDIWTVFSLEGSSEALNQLGKQAANNKTPIPL